MNTIKVVSLPEVSSLLCDSVPVVFQTMLGVNVSPLSVVEPHGHEHEVVLGSVGFTGDVTGMVYLQLGAELARSLSGRMLNLETSHLDDEMINDVVGELSNMIVGSVKSQLCDSGTPCALTIPTIVRGRGFNIEQVGGANRRVLDFSCDGDRVTLQLLMKSPA